MHNLTAALMMTAAMAAFAVEDAVIKYLSASQSVGLVVAMMGVVGTLAFALIAARGGVSLLRPEALRGTVLARNLAEVVAAGTMVLAISLVPLTVVSAILQTMPLAVTLAAALVLGESVGWRRWSAIAVGFSGVLLILRPGSADFDPAALLSVVTVAALTVRDLATRRVPEGVHSIQLSGWGFAAAIVAGLLLLALGGEVPPAPPAWAWALILLAAGAGMAGYVALVAATRLGDVAATTPYRYTRLLFAMAIGAAVFGERPDLPTIIGSALIVAAGLYSLWRETRLRRAALRAAREAARAPV